MQAKVYFFFPVFLFYLHYVLGGGEYGASQNNNKNDDEDIDELSEEVQNLNANVTNNHPSTLGNDLEKLKNILKKLETFQDQYDDDLDDEYEFDGENIDNSFDKKNNKDLDETKWDNSYVNGNHNEDVLKNWDQIVDNEQSNTWGNSDKEDVNGQMFTGQAVHKHAKTFVKGTADVMAQGDESPAKSASEDAIERQGSQGPQVEAGTLGSAGLPGTKGQVELGPASQEGVSPKEPEVPPAKAPHAVEGGAEGSSGTLGGGSHDNKAVSPTGSSERSPGQGTETVGDIVQEGRGEETEETGRGERAEPDATLGPVPGAREAEGGTLTGPTTTPAVAEVTVARQEEQVDAAAEQRNISNSEGGITPVVPASTSIVEMSKPLTNLYDEVLQNSELKGGNYTDKYAKFKKEFHGFTISRKEYNMVKQFINDFSKKGKADVDVATAVNDVFKRALTDDTYSEEFKNVLCGMFSFSKRYSYLNQERNNNAELYNKTFEIALSLLDTTITN
ncbi:MSP7-like protein, putative [Plasmodium ovale]|uniref:Merozoite surface protein 7 (MSP7), putative n=2 Tax=Plasmodium ovale TaxID=36330 RepID=A0A1A8WU29_PLAOA|nr:merozoite surface protein 7 (MSP7), putative [Plasmodium ovale curtisi]SBS96291.1 merozoite surface protein 7 (MSP7), putative [Plasmodium ovale curtisi]SCP05413.1 MSP7-like protein, putative [Plasmodium ovale]